MSNSLFLFETEDGASGANPCNDAHRFTRKAFNPKVVTKIRVRHSSTYIYGFNLFDKNGASVCEQVYDSSDITTEVEVVLQPGERLLGIKSTRYLATNEQQNIHCNLTLVIGWLE